MIPDFSIQIKTHPVDGGPIYFETDFSQFIVEPWNMASAVIFMGIALYWIFKAYPNAREHRFLFVSAIMLLIGGIGGTIYHGFRVSRVMIMMDWLPILLLCLAAAFYFLRIVYKSWWSLVWVIAFIMALQWLNQSLMPPLYHTSISYVFMALTVLIPTFILLYKTGYFQLRLIIMALVSFGLALTFRILDPQGILPQGTHFLWHLFGAFATQYMFLYIYLLNRDYLSGNVVS